MAVHYFNHTLVAFGGAVNVPVANSDVWTCTLRGGTSGGTQGPHSDPAAMLAALTTPLNAWWTTLANQLNPQFNLQWAKVNSIDNLGHYSSGPTNLYTYPSPAAGGGSTATLTQLMPSNVTAVVTFLTTAARGRTSHGRISLPFALYATPGGSPTLGTGLQTVISNATKALLALIQTAGNASGSSFIPRVYSSVGAEMATINKLRVGNRMDTQNRRKNKVPETPYVLTNYP